MQCCNIESFGQIENPKEKMTVAPIKMWHVHKHEDDNFEKIGKKKVDTFQPPNLFFDGIPKQNRMGFEVLETLTVENRFNTEMSKSLSVCLLQSDVSMCELFHIVL